MAKQVQYQDFTGDKPQKLKMKHPGFKNVQKDIANQKNPKTGKPYGKKAAGAILAKSTRSASTKAKKANPRLKRVK